MKSLWLVVCLFVCARVIVAQDRGTITGTISDPAGAVVANASIEARNLETGVVYPVVSTTTGNYTIAQLPVGQYEVSAGVAGFKKFTRSGITVPVGQVLRIDIGLEVGQATESVTVQADASQRFGPADLRQHNLRSDDATASTQRCPGSRSLREQHHSPKHAESDLPEDSEPVPTTDDH
jgi:hypothetical protein